MVCDRSKLGGIRARFCRGGVAAAVFLIAAGAGRGEDQDGYQQVRIPCFNSEDHLVSEIQADRADARGPSASTAKVRMWGVCILVFCVPPAGSPAPIEDRPPPVRMVITSDEGWYERSGGGSRDRAEDLAHLEGNVVVTRYAIDKADAGQGRSEVDTRIFCDNATWDHVREILAGTGPVKIVQPTTVLEGRNFLYQVDVRDGEKKTVVDRIRKPLPEDDGARYGGEMVLQENVSMQTIHPLRPDELVKVTARDSLRLGGNGGGDKLDPTVVTSRGPAIYNLDTRIVQFQDQVRVDRPGKMEMMSDCLRVHMDDKEQMIEEMVAWGNVIIRGAPQLAGGGGREAAPRAYSASGDYARFDVPREILLLWDRREGKLPIALFGADRIEDGELHFDFKANDLARLTTQGGRGHAVLHRVRPEPAAASGAAEPAATDISYEGSAVYDRGARRAVFRKNVRLVQKDMCLDADILNVDLAQEGEAQADQAGGVEHMVAEGHVRIGRGLSQATAEKAEWDRAKNTLVMTGPPHPSIEEPGRHRLSSPRIEVIQYPAPEGERARAVLTGSGGPGSQVFLPRDAQKPAADGGPADITLREERILIRYDDWMRYNEASLPILAEYHRNVVAETDAYVVRSDELDVVLAEIKDRSGGAALIQPQRIVAKGNASLHAGRQHFSGHRIVREVAEREVTLFGNPDLPPGADGAKAQVWEEDGVRFRAPRIVAREQGDQNDRTGSTVQAEGAGEIVLPDGGKDAKATVTFSGKGTYWVLANRTGKALFSRNVVLIRQANGMVITGEEMEVFLEGAPAAAGEKPGSPATLQRLRRVVMRGNVRVTQGKRQAHGSEGELLVRDGGDVITLIGNQSQRAKVVDRDGIELQAPRIAMQEATSVMTAEGPGQLDVTSAESLRIVDVRIEGQSAKRVHYRVLYDGQVKYNSLARKITFRDNVRLLQENLEGRCDDLILLLDEVPAADSQGGGDGVRLRSAEAAGRVRFKRFEPPRFSSDLGKSPFDRVGKIIFTKSEKALYDIAEQSVRLHGGPPRPEALQQTNGLDDKGSLQRSRVRVTAEKTILLHVPSGDVKCEPRPVLEYRRVDGPMAFD